MKLTPDYIRDTLLKLGFSPANKGFRYIIDAVMIIEGDNNATHNVTKQIYAGVAKKHGCSWLSVERCIRKSIDSAMSILPEKIEDYLKLPVNSDTMTYKNSDFLAAFHMALHRG